MRVSLRVPLEDLDKLERQETNAKFAKRLRVVILAIRGYTAPAVAMSLGLSRRVVQRWVRRYNDEGIPGLKDRRGNQQGGPLTPEQEEGVRQRLEAGPTPEDKVCSLRGADMQRIVQQEFGVWRCLSAIYGLLHRMGYSYTNPNLKRRDRRIANSRSGNTLRMLARALFHVGMRITCDLVLSITRQTQKPKRLFSPNCLSGLLRYGQPIPINVCGSFSKTNPALGNRARQPTSGLDEARGPAPCVKPTTNIFGCSAWFVPRRARPKDY